MTNPAFQKEIEFRITNFSIEMETWELRLLVFVWAVVWKSDVLLGLEAPLLYIKNVKSFIRTAARSTDSVYQERWVCHKRPLLVPNKMVHAHYFLTSGLLPRKWRGNLCWDIGEPSFQNCWYFIFNNFYSHPHPPSLFILVRLEAMVFILDLNSCFLS
jgi:hypothetical protein